MKGSEKLDSSTISSTWHVWMQALNHSISRRSRLMIFLQHLAEPFLERTRKQQQQLVIQLPDTLPLLTTDLSYLERILD